MSSGSETTDDPVGEDSIELVEMTDEEIEAYLNESVKEALCQLTTETDD